MKSKLLSIKNVKVLSKKEQKGIVGGCGCGGYYGYVAGYLKKICYAC